MDPHVESLIAKYRIRASVGLCVDTTRQDLPTAEWLQHLQDKLMDAAVYAQRLLSDAPAVQSDLQSIVDVLDKTADGVPIATEGPVWTPDGRPAFIEPFRQTPMARIKGRLPEDDEWFEARICFSTLAAAEAAEAAGGK